MSQNLAEYVVDTGLSTTTCIKYFLIIRYLAKHFTSISPSVNPHRLTEDGEWKLGVSHLVIHLPKTIQLAKMCMHVCAYMCVCGCKSIHAHVDAGEEPPPLSFSGAPSISLETGSLIGLEHSCEARLASQHAQGSSLSPSPHHQRYMFSLQSQTCVRWVWGIELWPPCLQRKCVILTQPSLPHPEISYFLLSRSWFSSLHCPVSSRNK